MDPDVEELGLNWTAILLSFSTIVLCRMIAPVIHRRLWKNHLMEYNKLDGKKRIDFDKELGTLVFVITSMGCLVALLYKDIDQLRRLGLVGSTWTGNLLLGMTVGVFMADPVYDMLVLGQIPEFSDLFHHGVIMVGALIAHRYFHLFALYRYIHVPAIPLTVILGQMKKLNFDTKRWEYKLVDIANVCIVAALRLAVVPFHWFWMMQTSVDASDMMEVPLWAWVATLTLQLLQEFSSVGLALHMLRRFTKVVKTD